MKNKKFQSWPELPPIHIPKTCFNSQKRAHEKLVNQATDMKLDAQGSLDPEQYYLRMVESTGTALSVGGLRQFLGGVVPVKLKHGKGAVYDDSLQSDVVLLPDKDGLWASEARLNRFLIRLGRSLAKSKTREKPLFVPDWQHRVEKVLQFVVAGWCERILVDGEHWPPLCCLSAPALAKFLTLCKKPLWENAKNYRTLEQHIRRLGLHQISKGRIKEVERRFGQFRFR